MESMSPEAQMNKAEADVSSEKAVEAKDKETKVKDSGMHLIIEPGYNLESLREYIKGSCLADRFQFMNDTDSVEEICQRCIQFLRSEELNLDEITTMFVVSCMCYYVDATPETIEWRSQLLQKAFQYVDTLSPMHLHLATKRLWLALKSDDIDYVFNLLTLSHLLAFASQTGRAIAICLIWTILFEITENKYEMYSFHEFSELIQTLQELDDQLLPKAENIRIVYILVQCIGYLVNSIVFGINEDFKKAGYRNYFAYSKRDLEKLKKYADHLCSMLTINFSQADTNFELRMTITEYLKVNIIGLLDEKINEIKIMQ